MKLVIEARLESEDTRVQHEPIRLASIERPNDDLERLGLSLEEGRELMAATVVLEPLRAVGPVTSVSGDSNLERLCFGRNGTFPIIDCPRTAIRPHHSQRFQTTRCPA